MNTNRPIVYSICLGAEIQFQYLGNLWRIAGDITDSWSSVISEINANTSLYYRDGPGHWNDPDMLEVGNGGMTDTEYRAHFAMWCIMAAPLIMGHDVRNMTQATKDILTVPELIAIDQDLLGYQGRRIGGASNQEVWKKQLFNGDWVVVSFNRGTSPANITVNFSDFWGAPLSNVNVRDSRARRSLGTYATSFSSTVPGHGVVMVRLSTAPDTTPPAAVNDLAVSYVMANRIVLTWTAPGNDGNLRTAVKYDVRYATFPITNDALFDVAVPALDEPRPSVPGSRETCTVKNLLSGVPYFFALKTLDDIPNASALSNMASATTATGGMVPPAAVNDVRVQSYTDTTVTLMWTAPGDDNNVGIAQQYDIRHATFNITDDAAFSRAKQLLFTKNPVPVPAGQQQSCTVDGLTPTRVYYFALKAADEFDTWSVTSNTVSQGTTPIVWQSKDIGTVGLAGSCMISSGVFTVRGAGSDIYPLEDSFHFVYTPLRGDETITARVVSITNADDWTKIGVMLRGSLDHSLAYVMMVLPPNRGAVCMLKGVPEMGNNLIIGSRGGITPPYWVRVRREGYAYYGEISPDGVTWSVVGSSQPLYLYQNFDTYVGLCVNSHNTGRLASVVYDNVSVSYAGYVVTASTSVINQPPLVSLTSPVSGSTYTAPATVTFAATATDSDGAITVVRFCQGTTLLNTDSTSPYEYTWTGVGAGSYILTAQAVDNGGAVGISLAVTVTVNPEPQPQQPQPELQPGEVRIVGGQDGYINATTNPNVTIRFRRTSAGAVTVRVYDLRGRLVREKRTDISAEADGEFALNVSDLPAGVYVVCTKGGSVDTRIRMAIIR